MTDHRRAKTRAFLARIAFRSGPETFAEERIEVWAIDDCDAERLARIRAEDSPYYNPRVPELNLEVAVEPGPDNEPPPNAVRSGRRRSHPQGEAVP